MAEPDTEHGIQADPPPQADQRIQAEPPLIPPRIEKQQPTRVRWLIFALACAVSWLLYLHRYAWSVIKTDVGVEYGLSDIQLGWLDSLFQVTYAIGQVPGGLAGDLYGPRAVLSLSILVWSGMVAALALVTGAAGFTPVRLGFGLAQAAAYPNLSKVTRSWFPLSVRTTVQGFVGSLSGRAGGACAPLIVGTLLMAGMGLGWRGAMVAIASAGFLLTLAFWLLFRNSPAEHPWSNAAERDLIDDAPPAAPTSPGQQAGQWQVHLDAGNVATLTAMLLYALASTFVDQLFVNWVPQFLEQGRGLSKAATGVFASLPLFGGAIGGAVGGALNDWLIRRTGNRRWSRCAVALTGKTLGAVLLAVAVMLPDGRAVALTLLACKFFADWSMTTLWGAITDVGGKAAGTVFGIVNMAGAIAGIIANPWIGWLKQEYGWDPAFYFLAVVFLLSALAWLFINSNRRLIRET
ncbi:hypothetical protein AYO44_02050 [Planctomycetaceae bacterium SCGC AG-212-F19]|nr:hypothetical protein AYO44_02050 [Planctomycetaceae bacterium SCGC AG-212-F19]